MPSRSVVRRASRKRPKSSKNRSVIHPRGSGPVEVLHFTLPKGLSRESAISMLRAKAKKKGKTDARGVTYDPRTGRGSIA